MRPSLLVRAFVLCAALFVVAEAPQAVTPQPTQPGVTLEDLLAPAPAAEPAEACDAQATGNTVSNTCGLGVPPCFEDEDCSAYCGTTEFAHCDIPEFFPSGCCVCLG